MFLGTSFAFLMIQQILAIWSLAPVPFLNPNWISGISWFMHCWSLVNFCQIEVAIVLPPPPLLPLCYSCFTIYSDIQLQVSPSLYHYNEGSVYFCLFISDRRAPFNISYKANQMLLNFLSLCLSWKTHMFPSYLKYSHAGQNIVHHFLFSIF